MEHDKSILLVDIDTSKCRINNDSDPNSIGRGLADLTTFTPGQDFKCVSHNNILSITPSNGKSFTTTLPDGLGPVPSGFLDHVKFLAYTLPLVLPIDNSTLNISWKANGKQLNVEDNPYEKYVSDPNSDIRLACVGLNSIDPSTYLVFDFFISNKVVYGLIERLPGLESVYGTYASYSWAYPLFKDNNLHKEFHKYTLKANGKKGTMVWLIDNKPVMKYSQFGFLPSSCNVLVSDKCGMPKPVKNADRYLFSNHGGANPKKPIELINLQAGIGLFTLLDWYSPTEKISKPLVRLDSSKYRAENIYYYNNRTTGKEAKFVENSILSEDGLTYLPTIPNDKRIWGQGAQANIKSMKVKLEKAF